MDPSRIRLEDDRFGLIGACFRPENRATFRGRDDDDLVWSIGIVVGDEDEIQTVEIDEHGAKSSRMLTPGELFEGLEILAKPGSEAHLIVGTLTLLGMDLRASNPENAHEFAEVMRSAAEDRNWKLPLHLIGQPRDLQLSAQGRDILRKTAGTLEQQGEARTSLSAARRLELSAAALDSVRRRIARRSLQAYRMHGRWYVVLDNLARSRPADQNGTSTAAVPSTPVTIESEPSPFVEAEESVAEVELEQPEAEVEFEAEPFVAPLENQPQIQESVSEPEPLVTAEGTFEPVSAEEISTEQVAAPTEQDLSAFVAGAPDPDQVADEALAAEVAAEQETAQAALTRQTEYVAEEPEVAAQRPPETAGEEAEEESPESRAAATAEPGDTFVSEFVFEQFIITESATAEPEPFAEEIPESQAEQETAEDVESDQFVAETTYGGPPSTEMPIEQPESATEIEAEPLEAAIEEAFDAELEVPSEEAAAEFHVPEEPVEERAAEQVMVEPEADAVVAEPETEAVSDLTGEEAVPVAETEESVAMVTEEPAPSAAEEASVVEEPITLEMAAEPEAEPEPESQPEQTAEAPTVEPSQVEHRVTQAEAGERPEAAEESEAIEELSVSAAPEEAEANAESEEVSAEPEEAPQIAAEETLGPSEQIEAAEPETAQQPEALEAEELTPEAIEVQSEAVPEPELQEPATTDESFAGADETVLSESSEAPEQELEAPQWESTEQPAAASMEAGSPEAESAEETAEVAAEVETPQAETTDESAEAAAETEESESSGSETGEEATQPTFAPQFIASSVDLLNHLRDEVAFLRQQGQEKDRQIVAWINGAQWLQPFVDQIRSLEQQVERLGEQQAKRDGDRIADLMLERNTLRERLANLESEIEAERAARSAADESTNRRSWFRRMMS